MFGNDVNSDWKKESDIWLFTNPAWKNHATRMLGGWSPDNPNSDIPAISNNTANQEQRFSSWFIEDGSYIKLRNIELGYTFNFEGLKKAGISNLRLYTNGTNLITIDGVKDADPEQRDASLGGYPLRKIINFGVQATF